MADAGRPFFFVAAGCMSLPSRSSQEPMPSVRDDVAERM